jgi:excisionase family DNA binding protein
MENQLPKTDDGSLEFFSIKEVAQIFKVSRDTLEKEMKRGLLEFIRVGGQIRISKKSLKKYCKWQTNAPREVDHKTTRPYNRHKTGNPLSKI